MTSGISRSNITRALLASSINRIFSFIMRTCAIAAGCYMPPESWLTPLAVPAGEFGVTLIAPAWSDEALLQQA
jgi:hypothetical protein